MTFLTRHTFKPVQGAIRARWKRNFPAPARPEFGLPRFFQFHRSALRPGFRRWRARRRSTDARVKLDGLHDGHAGGTDSVSLLDKIFQRQVNVAAAFGEQAGGARVKIHRASAGQLIIRTDGIDAVPFDEVAFDQFARGMLANSAASDMARLRRGTRFNARDGRKGNGGPSGVNILRGRGSRGGRDVIFILQVVGQCRFGAGPGASSHLHRPRQGFAKHFVLLA